MRVASISIDVSISLSHIYISKFVRFASYKGGGMNDYEEGRSTGGTRVTGYPRDFSPLLLPSPPDTNV